MIKIVIIRGGLGNQMFGYAFYSLLKKKYWYSFVYLDIIDSLIGKPHNGYELIRLFGVPKIYNYKLNVRIRRIYTKYFTHKYFTYIKETDIAIYKVSEFKKSGFLKVFDGYWQSEKYFEPISNRIRKKFAFKIEMLNESTLKILGKIRNSNSVSIHVRRGDYLNEPMFFGICNLNYFQRAVNKVLAQVSNPEFFVFSDDHNWIKNNFKFFHYFLIDWNKEIDNWQDMFLISQCKHNIIANSTFSWWGAWLNKNPNKIVIAPQDWKISEEPNNIIPKSWEKV